MKCFVLLTVWRVQAPLDQVWSTMVHSERWPRWWRSLESVTELEPGGPDGVGNVRRYVWRSPLFLRLRIDMHTTAVEPRTRLAAVASGDASGTGEWRFQARSRETIVEYDWRVQLTRPGLRHMAWVLAPLFARSHRAVMTRGAQGLGRELGCRVDAEC